MRRVPDALVGECPGRNHADEEVCGESSQCIAEVNVTQAEHDTNYFAGIRDMAEAGHSVAA